MFFAVERCVVFRVVLVLVLFLGYARGPGDRVILGAPCEVLLRRRATLPRPVERSTIAVLGLSFRVRNGTGRLPQAMAAANL